MFSYADVEKLRRLCVPGSAVLSLYLAVPLDPAGIRGLAAEAAELMASAVGLAGGNQEDGARVGQADREAVLDALTAHGRDWGGHTVAIFACRELGLFEALPLPCLLPEQAVLTSRPYIRPLLAAVQRCPDYRVAIADREHARVLSVRGSRVETVATQVDRGPRGSGFGGWYGLQAYRIQRRIIELGRHHYRDTAAILERAAAGGHVPLVIGGHRDSIAGLLRALPPAAREAFAGSFRADPHTLTGPGSGSWLRAGGRDPRRPVQRRREAALPGHRGRERTMKATETATVRVETHRRPLRAARPPGPGQPQARNLTVLASVASCG